MKKKILIFFMIVCFCASIIPLHAIADSSTAKIYEWKQTDKRWNKIYSATWSKGCAVTAIAVQIARTKLVKVNESSNSFNTSTGEGFNPGSFAKAMNYNTGSLSVKNWDVTKAVPDFKIVTDAHFGKKASSAGFNYFPAKREQQIIDAMKYYLDQGYYPIIEGPGSKWSYNKGSRHYVAVVEVKNNKVYAVDPAEGKKKDLFSISVGGNKWTAKNLEKCGIPDGYACCRLYKVNCKHNTGYQTQWDGSTYIATVCKRCGVKFAFKVDTSSAGSAVTTGNEPVVHSDPYKDSPELYCFARGVKVNIIGKVTNAYNNVWYKVSYFNPVTKKLEEGYIYKNGLTSFVCSPPNQ